MYGIGGTKAIEATYHVARGIRVVSFDPDVEVHARLRSTVAEEPDFILVGESREWEECEVMLDRFVPELLVANMTQVPPKFLEDLSSSAFPILIGLQAIYQGQTGTKPYGILPQPLDRDHVHDLLDRVRCEICRRKADELSALLEQYVSCVARCGQYLAQLKVDDGDQTEVIDLERIVSFSADRNYIRVHTDGRAFAIRDTMTAISAKLDPSRFARVHRSFIVNLSQVRDVVTREGSSTFVILSNGMEVPVGPNYRDDFSSAAQMRNRLIA
jgi:two-component system, LytTR family, response regulator